MDFKAPEGHGKNTIDQLLRSAARQGDAAVIHLQKERTELDAEACKDYIRSSLRRRRLDYVLLIDYDGNIVRVERDTETASHSQSQ